MPVLSTTNEALNRAAVKFQVKVEALQDDGVTWLDLTDKVNFDRLASFPGLTCRQERGIGAAEVSISTLRMDNADRFWDLPPPVGITTWFRRKIRVSLITQAGTQSLGIWLIDDVETATDDSLASITLVTLAKRLIDKQADRVKNGRDWYTNRPIGWLVRELLSQEFKRSEVQSWTNVLTRYQIPLADPTTRAVSSYGRPPEFDGTVWREDSRTLYGSPYVVVNTAGTHYGKHWMGIGGELWKWDPDTDVWTKWCAVPAGRANFKLFHLYVNVTRNKVIAVGWEIEAPGTGAPGVPGSRTGAKNGDVALFYADMTTPPATLNEFTGKPANIWTGHYAVRAGRVSGGGFTRMGGTFNTVADADLAGVNCPVPAGHWMQNKWTVDPLHIADCARDKAALGSKLDIDTGWPGLYTNNTWVMDSPGYKAATAAGANYPLDFRFSIGQARGAFAHQNAGDEFVCTVVSWDGALARYRFRLWKLNTNTGAWTDTGYDVMQNTDHFQPYSFAFRSDDLRLLCAAVLWKESAWTAGAPLTTGGDPFTSVVVEYTYPLVASGTAFQPALNTLPWLNIAYSPAGAPEKFWAIVFDAIYGSNTDYILCSGIDSRNILSSSAFVAFSIRISTFGFGPFAYSSGRFSGAVCETATARWFLHDGGSNQVRRLTANSISLVTWGFEDDGFPPVAADPSLLMGLVLDVKRSAIFGVSGPGAGAQANAEIMNNGPLSGKYYLWQLAGWLTDRVELADFSDSGSEAMMIWAALEELAAMMDGVFRFDETGAFYFKARPKPQTITATLAANTRDDVKRVPGILVKKRSGSKKLFNVAEMTPSIAVLRPPSGTVRVLARPPSFGRPPWNAALEVFQGNNRSLNILMRCVQGALAGSEDDGSVRKTTAGKTMVDYTPGGSERIHKLRFAFLIYDTMIESQLVADVTPASDLIVIPIQAARDVRGVESGIANVEAYAQTDEVMIGDTERYTVRSKTDDPANGKCTLRLDRNVTTLWTAGTKLTVRTRGNNRWSDHADGITYFTTVLGAVAQGTVATLDVFSTRDIAPGMVLRIDATSTEEMRVISVLNATQVSVRRGIGGTTATSHTTVTPVRAYWAPIVSAQYPIGTRFDIGGTGVSLRFPELPDSGENPFMVGDSIEIVCPGLKLEAQDKAKIISYNMASIAALGGSKIPWPSARASRFAGYRQSVEACKRIVADYGTQHYDLDVEMPLRWLPNINETFLLEDRSTLPSPSPGFSPNGDYPPTSPDTAVAIAAVVEGYTIDPMGDKVLLQMRALNPHV